MAYVDLVEHTHSALEVPLKMTNTESLISQSLSWNVRHQSGWQILSV